MDLSPNKLNKLKVLTLSVDKALTKTIKQSVPEDCIREGPNVVVRKPAHNDGIVITRRCGEGSKPLFARDDVKVNVIVDHGSINETTCKTISEISQKELSTSDKSSRKDVSTTKATTTKTNEYRHRGCYGKLPNPKYNSRRSNEVRNASPQKELITSDKSFRRDDSKTKATTTKSNEYRHRGCCGKLPNSRYSSRRLNKVRNASPPTDKGPYYLDKVRERDRLRRLYGSSSRRSLSPKHSGKKSDNRRSTSREKRHRHSPYERGRRQSNDSRRRSRSRPRSYSTDRDYKKRSSRRSRESRSPYPSHKLGSSRSYRTHSPRSERSTHRQSPSTKTNRDITTERNDNLTPVPPTPSYIPVPIPVPDYSFPFVPWPPTAWMHNMQQRPPPGHYGYSAIPMASSIRPYFHLGRPPLPIPYPPVSTAGYRTRFLPPFKQNTTDTKPNYKFH